MALLRASIRGREGRQTEQDRRARSSFWRESVQDLWVSAWAGRWWRSGDIEVGVTYCVDADFWDGGLEGQEDSERLGRLLRGGSSTRKALPLRQDKTRLALPCTLRPEPCSPPHEQHRSASRCFCPAVTARTIPPQQHPRTPEHIHTTAPIPNVLFELNRPPGTIGLPRHPANMHGGHIHSLAAGAHSTQASTSHDFV